MRKSIAIVEKWSDISHVKRALGNQLYGIKQAHKQLSSTVISHVQKCFTYALHQNRDNAASMSQSITNITAHLFGEHDQCGEWCQYVKDPGSYRHKGLPHGKDLSSPQLRVALENILSVYSKNTAKLAPLASSQRNKSFNNVVASKAPKSRHYGSSQSNDFRVAAAVCQTNIGHGFVSDVVQSASLSPSSRSSKKYMGSLESARQRSSLRKSKPETKRRRLEVRQTRTQQQASHEIREGVTYQSGCSMRADGTESGSTEIPAPVVEPNFTPIAELKGIWSIVVDVETTDTTYSAEMTLLSAADLDGDGQFSTYILPEGDVSTTATKVTGLSVGRRSGRRVLLHHGKEVASCSTRDAMLSFLAWARSPFCLLTHNAKALDYQVLMSAACTSNVLEEFEKGCVGFVDTLPLLKGVFEQAPTNRLGDLYLAATGTTFAAHDATADVAALKQVLLKSKATPEKLAAHSFSAASARQRFMYLRARNEKVGTLKLLTSGKVVSSSMAAKIAGSGLDYSHLKRAYDADKQDGLKALLHEEVPGSKKPRVTKSSKVLSALCEHFSSGGC